MACNRLRNLTRKYDSDNEDYLYTAHYRDSQERFTKVHVYSGDGTIDGKVEYKYYPLGGRVMKKVDNGPWRWYFYDDLKVLAEGSDTYDRTFYTLAPGAIGGIICRDGGSKYFYHYDRFGNVVGITDASGNVVRVYHNTAFGIWWSYDSDGYDQEVSDVQPYHLTTKEYDSDIGLFYFSARWYARWPGRFISRARVRRDEEHPYACCENNPVSHVDPTGKKSVGEYIRLTIALNVCSAKCLWEGRKETGIFGDGACGTMAYHVCNCMKKCMTDRGFNCARRLITCIHVPLGYHSQCQINCGWGWDTIYLIPGIGICWPEPPIYEDWLDDPVY